MDGLNLFSKEKLNTNKIIEELGLNHDEILVINKTEDWLNKKNEKVVIEYHGFLDYDDEEYPGYHFYDVTLFENNLKDRFKKLEKYDVIVDME